MKADQSQLPQSLIAYGFPKFTGIIIAAQYLNSIVSIEIMFLSLEKKLNNKKKKNAHTHTHTHTHTQKQNNNNNNNNNKTNKNSNKIK